MPTIVAAIGTTLLTVVAPFGPTIIAVVAIIAIIAVVAIIACFIVVGAVIAGRIILRFGGGGQRGPGGGGGGGGAEDGTEAGRARVGGLGEMIWGVGECETKT